MQFSVRSKHFCRTIFLTSLHLEATIVRVLAEVVLYQMISTLCSGKNTHSHFLLYLPRNSMNLYKIFRKCLRWMAYSIHVKVRYLLILVSGDVILTSYTVSQKRDLYTFAHNFGRCWRTFDIFPLLNSSRNLQQSDCHIAHHTFDVLLHYLVKWQLSQTAIFISKQCP